MHLCDDGGWGSDFDVCDFGTDCDDCGVRQCDIHNLDLCLTSGDCTSAGGNWWSFNGCRAEVEIITEVVEVTSAGQVWMDRNLGASRVATSSADSFSYGYLYQWGRGSDGHQARTSDTTTEISSTDDPAHSSFIISGYGYKWRVPENINLWQGDTGINNPCPAGFRLPTKTELTIEEATWKTDDSAGAFASPLKIVLGGVRYGDDGHIQSAGRGGYYWSSTIKEPVYNKIYHLDISSPGLGANSNFGYHGFGMSVRCIQD